MKASVRNSLCTASLPQFFWPLLAPAQSPGLAQNIEA
jgi:hypothetical protein